MFQNSSEFKEVLDTQYKLFVRNGDALGDINLTCWTRNINTRNSINRRKGEFIR